jgi:DNA polymerase III alpha subunit
MPFTHLHTHSHFSLLEGVPAPAVLAAGAAQFKLPALALTDHNALYGAVPFYQACHAAGVQPLLGLELDTEEGDRLVLRARDFSGYRSSAAWLPPSNSASPPASADLDTWTDLYKFADCLIERHRLPRGPRSGKGRSL